uniref:Putative metal-nicotianamine transporter YSL12 n=1 Tax=Anthurium amnicola TaxID=1678845 RepID=A0A1D1ZIE7_9ARAE
MGMIMGDGMYNFLKVLYRAVTTALVKRRVAEQEAHIDVRLRAVRGRRERDAATAAAHKQVQDDRRRTEVFLEDQVPLGVAYGGYVAIAAVCVVTLPRIFPGFKWYYVVVVCTCMPVFAFCNAYCCGLTDWNIACTYGALANFVVGAWTDAAHGGVLAGLAAHGMVGSVVFTASELIRDFKTGYLTLASRRAVFVSQAIGTAMGCVISPCVFWLFYQAFDVGTPGTDYPAPFARIYRSLAILGADGFGSSLPKHCLTLCYAFFSAAFLISFVKDVAGKSTVARFIPIPTAMAIPLYFGSYLGIDMCLGSFIIYVWERVDRAKAEAFGPAVASGLMCGAGMWTLPESVLSLANVKPPICMTFLSRKTYESLHAVLSP